MAFVDPFVSLAEWRSSLYRGDSFNVDRFLDAIDATLPAGWARDREYESGRLRPDRIRCYKFDRPGGFAARAWLQRVTGTRARGGPIQLIRHPAWEDSDQFGKLVADFTDGCVLPAASEVGLRHSRPSFGLRSRLTVAVEMLFTRLADTSDGEWPLTDRAEAVWEELVSCCLAEHVSIDRDELARWIADSGWEPSVIAAVSDRLYADAGVLAKILETVNR